MVDTNELQQGQGLNNSQNNFDPEIDVLFGKIEDEYRKLNSNVIKMKNDIERERIRVLRDVLNSLKLNGVDPNDPVQINNFLDKLDEIDPDLRILFEKMMNNLLGGEQFDISEIPEVQQGGSVPYQEGDNIGEESVMSPLQQFPNLAQQ